MCSEGHRDAAIRAPYCASYQRGHKKITFTAAIFFWNGYACVALFGKAFPYPWREIVGALDFGIMGSYLIARKVQCAFIGKLVLNWKLEVHGVAVLSGVQQQMIL